MALESRSTAPEMALHHDTLMFGRVAGRAWREWRRN